MKIIYTKCLQIKNLRYVTRILAYLQMGEIATCILENEPITQLFRGQD